jgi:hypothetical protein
MLKEQIETQKRFMLRLTQKSNKLTRDMNRVFFMTLMWYRSWYLLREVTWESVCDFSEGQFLYEKK